MSAVGRWFGRKSKQQRRMLAFFGAAFALVLIALFGYLMTRNAYWIVPLALAFPLQIVGMVLGREDRFVIDPDDLTPSIDPEEQPRHPPRP